MNNTNTNNPNTGATPVPLGRMKLAELRSLEKKLYRVCRTLESLRKRLPELVIEEEHQWQLWMQLRVAIQACELTEARREQELWTVFVPGNRCVNEMTRTEHFTISRSWCDSFVPELGEIFKLPIKSEIRRMHPQDDPWVEFARLNQPKDVQVAA